MKISEIVDAAGPLDLLVFRSRDPVSKAIRVCESVATLKIGADSAQMNLAKVSHVGLVVTAEMFPEAHPMRGIVASAPSGKAIWEATMSGYLYDGVRELGTDKSVFGTQLRVLGAVLEAHLRDNGPQSVALCRLDRGAHDIVNKWLNVNGQGAFAALFAQYNNRSFNLNPLSLLGAVFPALRPYRDRFVKALGGNDELGPLFCSQFVASIYIAVGVINDESDGVKDGHVLDPSNVVPADFLGADVDGLRPFIMTPEWITEN